MHIHCLTQKIHILSVSSKILSNVDSFSKSVQYICWRTCIYIYIKGVYLSSFVILLSTHLTRQTDRQTDRQTASFPVFPGPGGKRYDYHHYHSLPPHPPSPSFLVFKMWVKMPRGDSLITSGKGGGQSQVNSVKCSSRRTIRVTVFMPEDFSYTGMAFSMIGLGGGLG